MASRQKQLILSFRDQNNIPRVYPSGWVVEILDGWSLENVIIGEAVYTLAGSTATRDLNTLSGQNYKIENNSILCLKCNKTSYHPADIHNKYCGNCREFLS